MPKKQSGKKLTPGEYENLGRLIEHIYEYGYTSRWRMYKMSFVKGVMAGLGGVIGATILLAILLWTLSLFKEVPLIGPLTNQIQSSIKNSESSN